MSAKANYFKIGLFVITGLLLAVIAVIIFGAGVIFKEEFLVETYIDGSVQGLSVGSPVKYRGVKIGEVKEITLASNVYGVPSPYVLVRSAIIPETLGIKKEEEEMFFSSMKKAAELGLRVRLASQGLTGVAYLEADYLDPDRFPPYKLEWKPKYPYLPSAPSTITQIIEFVEKILKNFESVDFRQVFDEARETVTVIREKLRVIDTEGISDEAKALLSEVRDTNGRLFAILNKPEVDAIFADSSKAMKRLSEILDKEEIDALFADSSNAMRRLSEILNKEEIDAIITDASGTMKNTRELTASLSKDVPKAVERMKTAVAILKKTLTRIDTLVASKEYDIEVLIDDLREIMRNLREVSETIKEYPSGAIFGSPPPPFEAGGKQK